MLQNFCATDDLSIYSYLCSSKELSEVKGRRDSNGKKIGPIPYETRRTYSNPVALLVSPTLSKAISVRNFQAAQMSEISQQAPEGQVSSPADFKRPVTIFLAYAREDIESLKRMELDLTTLHFQGLNITWDKSEITESVEWEVDIQDPLNSYDLVLLLVSPNFVGSPYCYSEQMNQAVERHQNGAWVSPILLRPCRWERTPFGIRTPPLPVLPMNKIPVTRWPSEDDAFLDISDGIVRAVKYLEARQHH